MAEDTGLIGQLGEWVLIEACAEAATWPDHVRLAVNVSPVQFRNHTLALHVASALAVPTVTIFGATDETSTGPTGPLARIVREHAECSPCLLRECPIDHRCMTRVTAARASAAALQLWEESAPAWTQEARF